jgi:DNA-binding response OmpR family regulator
MMGQGVRIAIIGESVLMEGIGVSLAENPLFSVECTGADLADALNLVNKFKPQVIVFDLELPIMQTMLSQMRDLVNLRLVALDDSCDRVLVMDSELFDSPSLADLQELIADSITGSGLTQVDIANSI